MDICLFMAFILAFGALIWKSEEKKRREEKTVEKYEGMKKIKMIAKTTVHVTLTHDDGMMIMRTKKSNLIISSASHAEMRMTRLVFFF